MWTFDTIIYLLDVDVSLITENLLCIVGALHRPSKMA